MPWLRAARSSSCGEIALASAVPGGRAADTKRSRLSVHRVGSLVKAGDRVDTTRAPIDDRRMLVLTRDDVRALLDLDDLIDALGPAMADLSAGRASVPDRIGALVRERDGRLLAMPGYVPSQGVLASKLVSLFPQNAGTAIPTHQGVIVAFDPATGSPAALLDGTEITAVRTAACSALSARLLAREDASVLAVVGTGVQAREHARALKRV